MLAVLCLPAKLHLLVMVWLFVHAFFEGSGLDRGTIIVCPLKSQQLVISRGVVCGWLRVSFWWCGIGHLIYHASYL